MKFDDLWKDLKFNATNAASGVGNMRWRIKQDNSTLIFKNQRYKSVYVHAAKQLLMSELAGRLQNIIPKYKKHIESVKLKNVLEQRNENYVQLIRNQEDQAKKWGRIDAEGGHVIIAKNKYGDVVPEALMLYYDDEYGHIVDDVKYVSGNAVTPATAIKETYITKTMCHIDLAPQVSMNSAKNIVMTQVQGRDYTRKELVSGGDLQFSISGNIVSEERGVYPADAVKKFIKIMQYGGILNVNFMMFEPFNVKRVIIKDFSLNEQTYKNIQPYSFSCVAVEPDEEIQITQDTIAVLNQELKSSKSNQWYDLVLKNKLLEIEGNILVESAASAIVTGVGAGLDELAPNI